MGNYYLYPVKEPSGRAKCLACRKPIRKDQPAISVGNFYFQSHEYIHAECVAEILDLTLTPEKRATP